MSTEELARSTCYACQAWESGTEQQQSSCTQLRTRDLQQQSLACPKLYLAVAVDMLTE